jgi:hypothetical protein
VGLLLGACAGGSEASQEDVQNDVKDELLEVGYIAGPGAEPVDVTEDQAIAISECVGTGLFDPDQFTKDERNDVTNPGDGTPPDPELVERFDALYHGCVADATEAGPTAPADEDEEG